MREARAVEALIAALADDESAEVRSNAAVALGNIGEARATAPLKTAALHDPDAQVRSTAIRALDSLNTADPVGIYVAALRDPDRSVRYRAIHALGGRRDTRAVAPLMEILLIGDETMGPNLVAALGQLSEPAMPPLIEALQNENPVVRNYAASALASIPGPRVENALRQARHDPDEGVRAQEKWALSMHWYADQRSASHGEAGNEGAEG